MALSKALSELRERINAAPGKVVRGSVELAGVPVQLGCVHEWFGGAPSPGNSRHWMPPMCVLADIARRAVAHRTVAGVLWIGRRVWPYPLLFDQHREVLRRSILIDPPDNASRLWAIDLALRTPSAVAVIADAEGLTLSHTRRLQLAAASGEEGVGGGGGGGGGALCLLARPPGELDRLSAATTRWRITHALSSTMRPRWTLALLRHKDRPALTDEPPSWTVEWNHAQGLICVPAALADRTGSTKAQAC